MILAGWKEIAGIFGEGCELCSVGNNTGCPYAVLLVAVEAQCSLSRRKLTNGRGAARTADRSGKRLVHICDSIPSHEFKKLSLRQKS
jgi:hypothetical protein